MADTNGQEEALVRFTSRLEHRSVGYQALHIHFSKLQPQNRTAGVMRVAESLLRRFVTTYDDQLFRMLNSDLILVCRGKQVGEVKGTLSNVQALVKNDPLFRISDGATNEFATWNDLSVGWSEFMARGEELLDEKISRLEAEKDKEKQGDDDEGEELTDELDAARLGRLENSLKAVDMSSFVRRQSVCAMGAGGKPLPVFDEIYVSVSDLRRATMPNVDIGANKWLFHQLTNTLDTRVIAALTTTALKKLPRPFSVNLNIATLMTDEFLKFVGRAKDCFGDKTFVVELHLSDVFSNVKEFAFARDMASEMGFRLCLDAVDHMSIGLINFQQMGFDLLKLFWDPDIDALPDSARDEMQKVIAALDAERLILARCERAHAVPFGRSLGIALFQGWHVDTKLEAKTT